MERCCKKCGEFKPLTGEYWSKDRGYWVTICRTCKRAVLAELNAARTARRAEAAATKRPKAPKAKRAWVPNPTGKGLAPSMGGWQPKNPPKTPADTLRRVLLNQAQARTDELAQRMVDMAVSGDPAMLKYVAEQLFALQDPDETPLARTLRSLVDKRAEILAGAKADRSVADAELGAGAGDLDGHPEGASEWGVPSWDVFPDGEGRRARGSRPAPAAGRDG